ETIPTLSLESRGRQENPSSPEAAWLKCGAILHGFGPLITAEEDMQVARAQNDIGILAGPRIAKIKAQMEAFQTNIDLSAQIGKNSGAALLGSESLPNDPKRIKLTKP